MTEVLLVPSDLGAPEAGTGAGPEAIYDAWRETAHGAELPVRRLSPPSDRRPARGDLPGMAASLAPLLRETRDHVRDVVGRGDRLLVLHGDDSNVFGIGAGLLGLAEPPGLVYLDAHGDANTPDTSPSDCLYGMPLALLMGAGLTELLDLLPRREGRMRQWPGSRMILGGTRAYDPGEGEFLKEQSVVVWDPRALDKQRGKDFVDAVLGRLGRRLWIHVDHDVVDPVQSGGTLCREPGGIDAQTLLQIVADLSERAELVTVSMGNYLPRADPSQRTLRIILELLERLRLT